MATVIACVASVSVRFRSKERGTSVKDHAKNGSRLISRAIKTETPLPRYLFAPKPNGNACYAGYNSHFFIDRDVFTIYYWSSSSTSRPATKWLPLLQGKRQTIISDKTMMNNIFRYKRIAFF